MTPEPFESPAHAALGRPGRDPEGLGGISLGIAEQVTQYDDRSELDRECGERFGQIVVDVGVAVVAQVDGGQQLAFLVPSPDSAPPPVETHPIDPPGWVCHCIDGVPSFEGAGKGFIGGFSAEVVIAERPPEGVGDRRMFVGAEAFESSAGRGIEDPDLADDSLAGGESCLARRRPAVGRSPPRLPRGST